MMFLNIYGGYDDNSSNKSKRTKNIDKSVNKTKTTAMLWRMLTKKNKQQRMIYKGKNVLPYLHTLHHTEILSLHNLIVLWKCFTQALIITKI